MKIHIKHLISGFLCAAVLASNFAMPIDTAALNMSEIKQNKITFSPMDSITLATPSGSWSGKSATWHQVTGATGYTVILYKGTDIVTTITSGFTTSADGSTKSFDFTSNITTTGHYTFSVTATSSDTSYSSSNAFTSSSLVYYTGLSLALVTKSGNSTSGGIINSATPTIAGTIGANNVPDNGLSGDTVTLYSGTPGSGNSIGSAQINGAGFTIRCNTLLDGDYSITAVVSYNGSKSDTSNPLLITTDTKIPTGYSIDNSLAAISTANISNYSFTIDNAEVGCTYNYTITGTGNSSITGSGIVDSATKTIQINNAANLKEGKLTLSVSLTDPAGNTGNTVSMTTVKNTGTAPAISTTAIQDGTVNTAYLQTLAASNSPTSWRISSGNLPDGLTLDTTKGIIGVTPAKAGTFTFGVTATNAQGDGPEKQYTITIFAIPTISTTTLPDGTINTAYTQTLQAANNPTSWSITSGNLPTGLSLNISSGVISGTPLIAGTYTFYVTAKNTAGSASQQLTIKIKTVPIITTTSIQNGNVGTKYSQTLQAANTPTSWKVSSGTLPAGLALDAGTGIISGTPTAVGTYTFCIIAANSLGNSNPQSFSVVITAVPDITASGFQDGKVGTAYTQALTATNKPTSWSMISGSLPAGLLFDMTTGTVSGNPTAVGTFAFCILATNTLGNSSIKQFTINIYDIPVISTTSLPNGQVNTAYYQSLTAINMPKTWSIVSGTLPAGLVMSATTGAISGYPTTVGLYTFSVTATNPAGVSTAQQLTIAIANGSTAPVNITINGSSGGSASTAKIPASSTKTSAVSNVTVLLNNVTVQSAASVLNGAIGGNDANWLEITETSAAQNTASATVKSSGFTPVFSFDVNLTRHNSDSTTTAVHQLGGNITCTVTLTDAQKSQLKGLINPCILYYDPDAKTLTDIKAVFNLSNGTATFSTDHLSSYVIAAKVPKYNVGAAYRTYVQRLGWQRFVSKGAISGTTGRSLGIQALNIMLTGVEPSGASITYQTYLHGKGWQKAISSGAVSNATKKNLNVEALRISINGLSGYKIKYRVHMQKLGWQKWKINANGTSINKALIAGTTNKGLRIESVQIVIIKA